MTPFTNHSEDIGQFFNRPAGRPKFFLITTELRGTALYVVKNRNHTRKNHNAWALINFRSLKNDNEGWQGS